MRPPLYGLLIGILLDILFWMGGPANESLVKFLTELSTPVAYVVSRITGWTFKQEEGIVLYVVSILITLPLLGLLCGLFYSGARMAINRKYEH